MKAFLGILGMGMYWGGLIGLFFFGYISLCVSLIGLPLGLIFSDYIPRPYR